DLAEIFAIHRLRGFEARQLGRLSGVQRLERNFQDYPGLPQPRQKSRERMLPASLFGSNSPKEENARRGRRGQQSAEPLKRVRIAPLHVVEIEQHRLAAFSESRTERFIEMKTLPALN